MNGIAYLTSRYSTLRADNHKLIAKAEATAKRTKIGMVTNALVGDIP
jgi:hypothetical protein